MPFFTWTRKFPLSSIRAKLVVSLVAVFLLCTTISVGSIWILSALEKKIDFLEVSNQFMAEIQQARRFEKNYLLYGTNLEDAAEHIAHARGILIRNKDTIEKILGKNHSATMGRYMSEYSHQIDLLGRKTDRNEADMAELRLAGSQMVTLAGEFVAKEQDAMRRMFRFSRRAPMYFTAILLVLMVTIFITLTRQLVMSLTRFMTYTKRIGEGDFSPIRHQANYSDEFNQLAEAFNQMVRELDDRHEILIQSHKLRAIGTLVAGVAHELNNPLNNSMLTASMLKEDYETLDDAEKMEMVDDLIHETERAQNIVRELLDFARESKTNIKPLEIDRIMKDSMRLVANQVKMSKVHIEMDIDDDLPAVHGDEQMLKQVFVNLILNAVDALPPKGAIVVSIQRNKKPGYVTVAVKDDGPGIPEHIQNRIFEPFFTTKAKGKGVGLGLSVSQGIVRKLGGYIHLDSAVGRGTTFTVAIPTTEFPSKMMSDN